jgi:hypothetical protein
MENIKNLVINILRYYQEKEANLKARKTKKSFHTLDSPYNTNNGNFETLCREKWIVLNCRLNRQDITVIFSLLRCIYYNDFSNFQNLDSGFDFLEEHKEYVSESLSHEEIRRREDILFSKLVSELVSYDDVQCWVEWLRMLNCEYDNHIKYHEEAPDVFLDGFVKQSVFTIQNIIEMI